MNLLRSVVPYAAVAAALWVAYWLVVDVLGRSYLATDMAAAGCVAIAVMGLVVLIGGAHQFNLGQGAFYAMGAYGAGILVTEYDLDAVTAILLSVVGTCLFAWPVGRILNRLNDLYFAVATLALTVIATSVIHQLGERTGGEDGLAVASLQVGSFVLFEPRDKFWLTWGAALLSAALVSSYLSSRRGRGLRAVGGDEAAARALGVPSLGIKTQAFVLSSGLAALGGALLTFTTGFIHPGSFGVHASIQLVVVVVLGAALVKRSLVIAFLVALLPVLFESLQTHLELIYGIVLVLVLVNMTRHRLPGEAQLWSRWATPLRRPSRVRLAKGEA